MIEVCPVLRNDPILRGLVDRDRKSDIRNRISFLRESCSLFLAPCHLSLVPCTEGIIWEGEMRRRGDGARGR